MLEVVPKALKPGDTIAFVSPSGRLNEDFPTRIERAKTFLTGLGFTVKIIFTSQLSTVFHEAVLQRCEEIHRAFRDPDVKAILCTIGGLSANELLPHLDYELIRKHPKMFCGYSDITLLHHALFTQAGLRTFYGPAAITQFGEFPQPLSFTTENFLQTLRVRTPTTNLPRSSEFTQEFLDWDTSEESQRPRNLEPSPPWRWLREGRAEGRIFGGCLPSVNQLTGSKYLPSYSGRILLLETPDGEAPGKAVPLDFARSSIADLRLSGILTSISGLILGRPYGYDAAMRAEWEKMVLEHCYGTDFPILANVDFGHTDPILTLPLDALMEMDSEKDQIVLLEPVVES